MKRLLFLMLLLVVLILLPVTGALSQDSETIVIRGLGNITTFNPALSSDGASAQAYNLLWPLPFEVDSFTGEPVPTLTNWEISEDGLTYTFKIRADANWSDGVPITSQDMKFVIEAVKSDLVQSVWKNAAATIEAVNVIDDKTYEIVLSDINCAALSDIGTFRFLPAHRFAPDFSDFMDNPINTNPDISGGSYILEEWAPDEFQRFRANPNYWEGEPRTPFLINRVLGDQAIAVQSLQAGEVDYTYLQGDLFSQLSNTDSFEFQIFPQYSVNFLSLNWVEPGSPSRAFDEDGNPIEQVPHRLFSDVNVRKAVAMGYNKADIIETLGGPQGGTPLIGPVSPTISWAYANDLQPYPYDPEAAIQLLEESGWIDENGDGVREKDDIPLEFTISYSDILQLFETTALIAQDQLSQIGFRVNLEKIEWANYLENVYFGQGYDATPMSNSGGTAPPDPNDFLTLISSEQDVPGSGNNLASYVNPEIDRLIEEARSAPNCDLDRRAELYHEIQRIAHEDVAYDWTFVPNLYQIVNNRIDNFNPGPTWVFYGYTNHVDQWQIRDE